VMCLFGAWKIGRPRGCVPFFSPRNFYDDRRGPHHLRGCPLVVVVDVAVAGVPLLTAAATRSEACFNSITRASARKGVGTSERGRPRWLPFSPLTPLLGDSGSGSSLGVGNAPPLLVDPSQNSRKRRPSAR